MIRLDFLWGASNAESEVTPTHVVNSKERVVPKQPDLDMVPIAQPAPQFVDSTRTTDYQGISCDTDGMMPGTVILSFVVPQGLQVLMVCHLQIFSYLDHPDFGVETVNRETRHLLQPSAKEQVCQLR